MDGFYLADWIGKVRAASTEGRRFESRIGEPRGDPVNTRGRAALEYKARPLAAFAKGASESEIANVTARTW